MKTFSSHSSCFHICRILSRKIQSNDHTLLKTLNYSIKSYFLRLTHKFLHDPILIYWLLLISEFSKPALNIGVSQLFNILFIAHSISCLFDLAHVLSSAQNIFIHFFFHLGNPYSTIKSQFRCHCLLQLSQSPKQSQMSFSFASSTFCESLYNTTCLIRLRITVYMFVSSIRVHGFYYLFVLNASTVIDTKILHIVSYCSLQLHIYFL